MSRSLPRDIRPTNEVELEVVVAADGESKGAELIASIDREIFSIMSDESWLDEYGLGSQRSADSSKDQAS